MSCESWERDWRLLRVSFWAYLAVWLGGLTVVMILDRSPWGGEILFGLSLEILFCLSLIPYIVGMVAAYRTQRGLFRDGYTDHRPWHIVAAAVILIPSWVFGFYPLWSVLRTAKRVSRTSQQEGVQAKRKERLESLREEDANRHINHASRAEVRGDYAEAIRLYSLVVEQYPGTVAARDAESQIELLRKENKVR